MKYTENSPTGIYYSRVKIDSVPENMNTKHCHDKYEILFVIDGKGKFIVEGVEYPVKPRTLMIFPPFCYHCAAIDQGASYERCILYFSDASYVDSIAEFAHRLFSSCGNSGSYYSSESITESIMDAFDKLEVAKQLPDGEGHQFSRLALSELLVLLSVAKKEEIRIDEGDLGARVIKYLNNNVDKDLSLDVLAKRFFVSKYYLCRAFKKHNGISVHGYINQKRVMHAKELIEGGETASGAAYRVGFGDYSAFYRAYVKIVGKSPTSSIGDKEDA